MKKVLAIILAMILCFSLCACNGGNEEDTESIEDKVKSAVKSDIMATIKLQYDTTGLPNITCYVDKISENKFEVTGKVTVKDKYGDSYTGKYDADVEYKPERDYCDVDLDIGSLYKD